MLLLATNWHPGSPVPALALLGRDDEGGVVLPWGRHKAGTARWGLFAQSAVCAQGNQPLETG